MGKKSGRITKGIPKGRESIQRNDYLQTPPNLLYIWESMGAPKENK